MVGLELLNQATVMWSCEPDFSVRYRVRINENSFDFAHHSFSSMPDRRTPSITGGEKFRIDLCVKIAAIKGLYSANLHWCNGARAVVLGYCGNHKLEITNWKSQMSSPSLHSQAIRAAVQFYAGADLGPRAGRANHNLEWVPRRYIHSIAKEREGRHPISY